METEILPASLDQPLPGLSRFLGVLVGPGGIAIQKAGHRDHEPAVGQAVLQLGIGGLNRQGRSIKLSRSFHRLLGLVTIASVKADKPTR